MRAPLPLAACPKAEGDQTLVFRRHPHRAVWRRGRRGKSGEHGFWGVAASSLPCLGVPATCPTPSPRPSCSWTPRRPKPTCPSLSFPGPPPAGAAAGQTKRRRSAGQPTGVGTARAPTLVPQGPRPGSSRSQVRLGLGRGQVRTRRGQLGGSGPGRRGRGQVSPGAQHSAVLHKHLLSQSTEAWASKSESTWTWPHKAIALYFASR